MGKSYTEFKPMYFDIFGDISEKYRGIKCDKPKKGRGIFYQDLLLEAFPDNIEWANEVMNIPIKTTKKMVDKIYKELKKNPNFTGTDFIEYMSNKKKMNKNILRQINEIVKPLQDSFKDKKYEANTLKLNITKTIKLIQTHFLKKIVDCLKIINYNWFSVSDLIDILGYSSKINCTEFKKIINSIQYKYHTKYKESDFPDQFINNGYPIYWIDLVDSKKNVIEEYSGVYEVIILIKEILKK